MTPEKQITRHQLIDLCIAQKSLAEAIMARDADQAAYSAKSAASNISSFLGSLQERDELNPEQANMAYALHTWLRKYGDSPVSCILWKMIHENRATPVWIKFVKTIVATKNANDAMSEAHLVADEGPTDWMIFHMSLKIWGAKDISKAVNQIHDWDSK